jgi:hypothetical protein
MLIEICRFDSFDELDRFDENSAVLIVLMSFGSFDERYSVMYIFDSHQENKRTRIIKNASGSPGHGLFRTLLRANTES